MDVTIIKKMPSEHVNYKLALQIHRSAKPKYFIGYCKYHTRCFSH